MSLQWSCQVLEPRWEAWSGGMRRGRDRQEREIGPLCTTVVQSLGREAPVILLWKLGLVEWRLEAKLRRGGRLDFEGD
jgi:hypothetical protein